jgi:hypothetical protein
MFKDTKADGELLTSWLNKPPKKLKPPHEKLNPDHKGV